ncbi:DUF2264 domain-containing protein [Demequina rhizosphaerae]|uniref:DUF2264 domain-containing protein n=1 Tax=Demequina rhizosphaerae TaxID=1638985 RepID=UPI0007831A58|nr:DUF2264 domain-containing protein [Demequina rhizosphaerae]
MNDPRGYWRAVAGRLADAAGTHASPHGSLVDLGQPYGRDGRRIAGLEGFARSALLGSFLHHDDPDAREREVARLVRAIAAGTDPGSPERWPHPAETGQVLAEMGGLALALRVLGAWDRDAWPANVRDRYVAYLHRAAEVPVPPNNWRLFRLAIMDQLRAFDAATPAHARVARDDATAVDALYRGGGWYSDGGDHAFDYYNSYAFHFYGPVMLHLGATDAWGPPAWLDRDTARERLRAFVPELEALLDPDGRPVAFGRSLTYRFATATALATAALLDAYPGNPAAAQARATACLRGFVEAPGVLRDGVLQPGWRGRDPSLLQDYSSTASSLWAGKLFAGLLLPAGHGFWGTADDAAPTATSTRLLLQRGDTDVALYNHASSALQSPVDAALPEDAFYGHLGYSSATEPIARGRHRDMSVEIARGTMRYRRGPLEATSRGPGWAASRAQLIATRVGVPRRLGGKNLARAFRALRLPPPVSRAGADLAVLTLLAGDTAIHVLRWPRGLQPRGTLTVTGWPVAGPTAAAAPTPGVASASGATLGSAVGAIPTGGDARLAVRRGAGAAIPTVTFDASTMASDAHGWVVVTTRLGGPGEAGSALAAALPGWRAEPSPDALRLVLGDATWTVSESEGLLTAERTPARVSPRAP